MKGFAYDMITLEMAIEEEGKPSGAIRIDDITRLIQVYMDQRFKYFTRRLHALLLKKPVAEALRQATAQQSQASNEYMIQPGKQEKLQQHEMHMYYNRDQAEKQKVQELVRSVEQKLKSYQGIVNTQLDRQKESIRDRIKMRKMRSETGSVKKYSINSGDEAQEPQLHEYFDSPPQKLAEGKSKNLVTAPRHDDI